MRRGGRAAEAGRQRFALAVRGRSRRSSSDLRDRHVEADAVLRRRCCRRCCAATGAWRRRRWATRRAARSLCRRSGTGARRSRSRRSRSPSRWATAAGRDGAVRARTRPRARRRDRGSGGGDRADAAAESRASRRGVRRRAGHGWSATLAMRRGDPETAAAGSRARPARRIVAERTWAAAQAQAGLGAALALLGRDGEAAAALDQADAIAHARDAPVLRRGHRLAGGARCHASPTATIERWSSTTPHSPSGSSTAWAPSTGQPGVASPTSARSRPGPTDARILAAALGASRAGRAALGLPIDAAPRASERARSPCCVPRSATPRSRRRGGRRPRSCTLEKAVAYARRARGTGVGRRAGWASLTPTELEVVGTRRRRASTTPRSVRACS